MASAVIPRLTHPHPSVTDPEQSRTARLLASLALALAGILGLAAVISLITSYRLSRSDRLARPGRHAVDRDHSGQCLVRLPFQPHAPLCYRRVDYVDRHYRLPHRADPDHRGVSVSLTSAYVVAVLIAAILLDVRATI